MPALVAAVSSEVGMIVPDLCFGIAFHLSRIGLAKANDTHRVGAKAENHHMHAVIDVALCFKPQFVHSLSSESACSRICDGNRINGQRDSNDASDGILASCLELLARPTAHQCLDGLLRQ